MKKIVLLALSFITSIVLSSILLQRVNAQVVGPTVSIAPADQTVAQGQEVSIAVTLQNNTEEVGGFEFGLLYDPALLQITDWSVGALLGSTGNTVIPLENIDNVNGAAAFGGLEFGINPGPTGDGTLAIITFATIGTGSSTFGLNSVVITTPSASEIANEITDGSVTITEASPSPTPAISPSPTATPDPTPDATPSPTPTPSPSVSPTPTPSASPSPSATPDPTPTPSATPVATPDPSPSPSATPAPTDGPTALSFAFTPPAVINEEFTVDVNFTTSQPVIGVDAIVEFDPTRITGISVDDGNLLGSTPRIKINNGNGSISISQVAQVGQAFTGSGRMATLHLRGFVGGQTALAFQYRVGKKNDSNAISSVDGTDILEQPVPLLIDIVNPAHLILSLTTPSEDEVLGHSVDGLLTAEGSTFSAQMTTDPSGTSNQVRLDNSFIGSLKTFFFKVSGFLRRSFSLDVSPGLNQSDIGALKAGDLNDDGIVNTLDVSLMYDVWFETGTADYNRDGIVNTSDYFILTQNYLQEDE
ncbi:TPA: hypothetical protein DIV55_00015 [Patescibacteria group bacterium]|nr:hypothetical protein [Patescibacteria group bacterium]